MGRVTDFSQKEVQHVKIDGVRIKSDQERAGKVEGSIVTRVEHSF